MTPRCGPACRDHRNWQAATTDGIEPETDATGDVMPFDERTFVRRNIPMTKGAARFYGRAMRRALRDDMDPQGTWMASVVALEFRRSMVDRYVREQFGLVVQAGPFKGMRYVENAAGSLYSPKILGCYEQELHPYVERAGRYRRFLSIGCAEGYYAVGIKRLAPEVEVFAFDMEERARELCGALRDANDVGGGFHIEGECTPARLGALAEPGTLVMVDIEGAEVDLLRAAPKDRLARCDLIVETHPVGAHGAGGGTVGAVVRELENTHDVTVVGQEPRDWTTVPELRPLGQLDRFLVQWEGRGPEPWVVAAARG